MPMTIIYLFYGMGFIMLGSVIIICRKLGDYFNISRDILPVGLFALVHGVNEWVDLCILKGEPFNVEYLKLIGSILLPVSFVFLIIFAARVIPQQYPKFKWLKYLWFLSFLAWALTYFVTKDPIISGIVARYFIALPGALLTALSLYIVQKRVPRREMPKIVYLGMRVAIFSFVLYGLLAGLVVPKADFLLANFVNYPNFINIFGLPVQFFRMLCALVLMVAFYGMFGVLLRDRELLKTILIITAMTFVTETGIMQILHAAIPNLGHFAEGIVDSLILIIILFPFIYVTIFLEMKNRRKAEEALAREKEFLDVTFQSIGDGIIATDTKARITLINRVAEALTGWSEKEAIGKPLEEVFQIINEETRQRCPNPVERVLSTGAVIGLGNHTILISRDKTEYFLGDSAAPIRDNAGNITGVVLVFRDISLAKKAEEKYRTIVNTSQDGFWITDAEARIVEVNASYCQMTGFSRDEVLKMRIPDLEAQEKPKETAKHILKVIEKGGDRFETRHRCKDGRLLDLEVSATYLKIGHGIGQFVAFLRDITLRKKLEARQRLAIEILESLNRREEWKVTIGAILKLLKRYTGLEVVAIRLKEGEDYPYFVQSGFSEEFVRLENPLCSRNEAGEIVRDSQGRPYLECMCGNILSGRTDPDKPFFTPGGSFWSNSTTQLLAATSEADRLARTRNRCNSEGYESVALIPLRSADEVIGLLQFNDRRQGCFDLEFIRFFEGIGYSIGIALKHRQMELDLQDKVLTLERFNKFAVGRETKMVDLKNQIEELKLRLEKKG